MHLDGLVTPLEAGSQEPGQGQNHPPGSRAAALNGAREYFLRTTRVGTEQDLSRSSSFSGKIQSQGKQENRRKKELWQQFDFPLEVSCCSHPHIFFSKEKKKENVDMYDVGQGDAKVTRQDGQRALRGEKTGCRTADLLLLQALCV